MTRDEHREKCIEAMLDAYWHTFDWNMHSHKARDCLIAAFDALHGIARVISDESWDNISTYLRKEGFTAFFEDDDLTNPPEGKP